MGAKHAMAGDGAGRWSVVMEMGALRRAASGHDQVILLRNFGPWRIALSAYGAH